MPELPEVELARRSMARWSRGATIVAAHSSDALVVPHPRAFAPAIVGRTVKELTRRGKYLRIELDDGARLFSHFGMTGKWVKRDVGDPPERFERARIDVERRGKRTSLRYVDARRLGRIVVVREDIRGWRSLGPDPLHEGVDATHLGAALRKRKLAVKEALMDGAVIAGIGNILAAESLWVARIHPRTAARALDDRAVRALARAIKATIERSLALEEGDEIAYVNESAEARAKNPFRVYGRAGEPCPRCRTILARIVQAGRSTVFCATCQPRVSPSIASRRIVRG